MKSFYQILALAAIAVTALVSCQKEAAKNDDTDDNLSQHLGHSMVDLGLSVKWATCNVGATKPEEYGLFFVWGYGFGQTWNGSQWSGKGFHRYINDYRLDDNGNLKPEYDSAKANWGGKWRMPTGAECEELINNCHTEWTTVRGVFGELFTSKKPGYTDKSIFLPAAGWGYEDDLRDASSCGTYWSSTFNEDHYVWGLDFTSEYVDADNGFFRDIGGSVRPVFD